MGEIENRLSRDLVEDLLDAAVTPEAAGARRRVMTSAPHTTSSWSPGRRRSPCPKDSTIMPSIRFDRRWPGNAVPA